MRIDEIRIQNFKHFKDQSFRFHPNFNLVIGVNGSGKTALLNAVSVAMGALSFKIIGVNPFFRDIEDQEVRVVPSKINGLWRFDPIFDCTISARGEIFGKLATWKRDKFISISGDSMNRDSGFADIQNVISESENGIWRSLPLLTFYACDRLWLQTNPLISLEEAAQIRTSRFDGYTRWFHSGADDTALSSWIISQTVEQATKALQNNGELTNGYNELSIVNKAIAGCLENGLAVRYDPSQKMVVVDFEDRDPVPFRNLSDGQRVLLAMVGDIARRATILNPHLGENVLLETPGIVLVDELDLHLHPKWQRRVIEDLRRTFPKIQFICTTHSPFLIQSLRSPEELISLDEVEASSLDNRGIEEIAVEVMGVDDLEFSQRYKDMLEAAKAYLDDLDQADKTPKERLDAFKEQLANRIAPFADNPAFQAFLERKRIAKMGE